MAENCTIDPGRVSLVGCRDWDDNSASFVGSVDLAVCNNVFGLSSHLVAF